MSILEQSNVIEVGASQNQTIPPVVQESTAINTPPAPAAPVWSRYLGNFLLFLSALPAFNIFFMLFLAKMACRPADDLLAGLGGLCGLLSVANLLMYILGIRAIISIIGFALFAVAVVLYAKDGNLSLSRNKTRLVIVSFVGLQYVLYFGLYRLMVSLF